jgi:hypothetical protein
LQNGRRPIEYSAKAVRIMITTQSGRYFVIEPSDFTCTA